MHRGPGFDTPAPVAAQGIGYQVSDSTDIARSTCDLRCDLPPATCPAERSSACAGRAQQGLRGQELLELGEVAGGEAHVERGRMVVVLLGHHLTQPVGGGDDVSPAVGNVEVQQLRG